MTVARIVVGSPSSASWTVTATTAPVSRSTACSALCARWVRPSFIFAIRASPSEGALPFFVRHPLLASSVQPRQLLPRRRLQPRGLRQTPQELLVALPRLPPHNRTHRRVGLQRRRIDANPLAPQQPTIR